MQQLARPCIVPANRLSVNKTHRLRHTDVRGANPMNTTINILSHIIMIYIKDKVQIDRTKKMDFELSVEISV